MNHTIIWIYFIIIRFICLVYLGRDILFCLVIHQGRVIGCRLFIFGLGLLFFRFIIVMGRFSIVLVLLWSGSIKSLGCLYMMFKTGIWPLIIFVLCPILSSSEFVLSCKIVKKLFFTSVLFRLYLQNGLWIFELLRKIIFKDLVFIYLDIFIDQNNYLTLNYIFLYLLFFKAVSYLWLLSFQVNNYIIITLPFDFRGKYVICLLF